MCSLNLISEVMPYRIGERVRIKSRKPTSECSQLFPGLENVVRQAIQVLESRSTREVTSPESMGIAGVGEEVVFLCDQFRALDCFQIAAGRRVFEADR